MVWQKEWFRRFPASGDWITCEERDFLSNIRGLIIGRHYRIVSFQREERRDVCLFAFINYLCALRPWSASPSRFLLKYISTYLTRNLNSDATF